MNFTRIVIKPSENEDYRYRLFRKYRYLHDFGAKETKESRDFRKLLKRFNNKVIYDSDTTWCSRLYITDELLLDKIGLETEQGDFVSFKDYFILNSMTSNKYGLKKSNSEFNYSTIVADGDTLHGLAFNAEKISSNGSFSSIVININKDKIIDHYKLLSHEEQDILTKRVKFTRLVINDNDILKKFTMFHRKKRVGTKFYHAIPNDNKNEIIDLLANYGVNYNLNFEKIKIHFYNEKALQNIGFEDQNGNIIYLMNYIKSHWTDEIKREDTLVKNGGVSLLNKGEIELPSEMEDNVSKLIAMRLEDKWLRKNELVIECNDFIQGLPFDISKVYDKNKEYIQLSIDLYAVEDIKAFDFLETK